MIERRARIVHLAGVAVLLAVGNGCVDHGDGEAQARGVPAVVVETSPTTTTRPSTTSTSSTTTLVTTTSTTPTTTITTTVPARPASIAQQFASNVTALEIESMATPVPSHVRDTVARLWLLLGRAPTPDELRTGVDAVIVQGRPLTAIADLLLASPRRVVPAPDVAGAQFVTGMYRGVLGRNGTTDEIDNWATAMADGMSPAEVAVAFAASPEAVELTGTLAPGEIPTLAVHGATRGVSDSVLRLYLGLLDRFPAPQELTSGVSRYAGGTPLSTLASELLDSTEYRHRRPGRAPRALLTAVYEDVLGRAPEAHDVDASLDQLERGLEPGEIVVTFTESAEAVSRTRTMSPQRPSATTVSVDFGGTIAGDDLLAVGDSVMLGAASALRDQIPGIEIDAVVGRQFDEGLAIVRRTARDGELPGTVIFHLGTNGPIGADRCDALMEALAGRRVVLINNRVPRPWEAPNNALLESCADRHGATLVDWHTDATGLAPDGYHMGSAGAGPYATLLASALTRS